MEQKTNEQRQAYTLYLQTEMTQEQIAELLKINRKTLHLWIKEGNWQRVKRTARYTPSMLADQYYRQLLAINDHIEMREEQPYPTKEESDVIRKLTLTIKQIKNRQTLNETLETLTMFMERLQQDNMELAQQIGPYTIKYVNSLAAKSTIDKTIDDMREDFILEQELNNQNNPPTENSPFVENPESYEEEIEESADDESESDQGTNGASQTTQPIDPQYADTPSQENNDEENSSFEGVANPALCGDVQEAGAQAEDVEAEESTGAENTTDNNIEAVSNPIPSDPYVSKHGNITVVRGKSPLMKMSQEERLNILHNPNPDKLKDAPNLWPSAPSPNDKGNKEEHRWNRRRISRW